MFVFRIAYFNPPYSTAMARSVRSMSSPDSEPPTGKSKEDESGVREADDQGLGHPTVCRRSLHAPFPGLCIVQKREPGEAGQEGGGG